MYTAIIVEDELVFRDMLLEMLPKVSLPIRVVATCATLRQAREAILTYNPQILFLDVELPDGKSIELLENLDESNQGIFEAIFVTSFDKYAIEAIKKNAVDYIMKPVELTGLEIALKKVVRRMQIYDQLEKTEELEKQIKRLESSSQQDKKIMIGTTEGTSFIRIGDIVKLESDSNYTTIFLENNKKFLASKTLSIFEELLEPYNFFRIHRQWIINLTKISSVENNNGAYTALLTDGSKIEISRRKKKDFFEKIAVNE